MPVTLVDRPAARRRRIRCSSSATGRGHPRAASPSVSGYAGSAGVAPAWEGRDYWAMRRTTLTEHPAPLAHRPRGAAVPLLRSSTTSRVSPPVGRRQGDRVLRITIRPSRLTRGESSWWDARTPRAASLGFDTSPPRHFARFGRGCLHLFVTPPVITTMADLIARPRASTDSVGSIAVRGVATRRDKAEPSRSCWTRRRA